MPVSKIQAAALLVVGLAGLAGCDKAATTGDQPAAPPGTATGSVDRQQVAPAEAAPAPQPIQQAAIQVQPGPDGATVTLNRAAVTGDVLTVQLTYNGTKGFHSQYLKLDEVSLVDDATAQRISVLKDNAGKWLAAPLAGNGEALSIPLTDTPTIVWFKFPAPPPTSKTVSLNLPAAAPFDGVPVTR